LLLLLFLASGLDDRGIVILMMDEQVEPPVAKDIIKVRSPDFAALLTRLL
jgi:hypothetical protein